MAEYEVAFKTSHSTNIDDVCFSTKGILDLGDFVSPSGL